MNVKEIIETAIAKHRDAFRAACIKQAEMHDDNERYSQNVRAKQGARASKLACLTAYDCDIDNIMSDTGCMVIALNIAAKIIGLTPAHRTAALAAMEG